MLTLSIWALRLLMSLVLLGWGITLARVILRRLYPRWALGPEDPAADPTIPISIVIPARNEINNLGPAMDCALAQDHPTLQLVVQDDGSSDGTGDVLDRYAAKHPERLLALHGHEALPEGWYGKPWALQRAQKHATGRWLVFVDADVRLAPECVSRVVAYGEREGLDMVTGLGRQIMESFWERTLQPAVAGVILMGNNLDEVNDPALKEKNLANGQLIAIRREAYDRLGGHEVVRNNILDDVGLAKAMKARDMRYHCLYMRRLFTVRMYTSFSEIWEGWTKNLYAGMHHSVGATVGALTFLYIYVMLGPTLVILSAAGLISQEWLVWGLIHWALIQGVRGVMDLVWSQNPLYGITHVPATAMTMALIVNSALRSRSGGVSWRGRVYQTTADQAKSAQQG